MVSDDPESFADLDGHDEIREFFRDFDSAINGVSKAVFNIIAGTSNASTKTFDFKVPDIPLQTADNQIEKIAMDATTLTAIAVPVVDAAVTAIEARSAVAAAEGAGESAAGTPVARGGKTFQTYTKTNPETGEVYSGRTSGTGTPQENIARRDAGHHMNSKGFGPAKLDKSSKDAGAIRGREQQLIDHYRSQGKSANKINGVSPKNPNASAYSKAAKKEFDGGAQ